MISMVFDLFQEGEITTPSTTPHLTATAPMTLEFYGWWHKAD